MKLHPNEFVGSILKTDEPWTADHKRGIPLFDLLDTIIQIWRSNPRFQLRGPWALAIASSLCASCVLRRPAHQTCFNLLDLCTDLTANLSALLSGLAFFLCASSMRSMQSSNFITASLGSRPSAFAAVSTAAASSLHRWTLTFTARFSSCTASDTRPIRPETRF